MLSFCIAAAAWLIVHAACCVQQTAHLVLLEYKQSMGNINCWAESTDEVLQECGQHGFELQSPSDADQRGSQICLGHKGGYPIMQVQLFAVHNVALTHL